MSGAHAKGPWVARPYGGSTDDSWYVRGPSDQPICGQGSGQVRGVNARLIAAAPELLDACLAVENGPHDAETIADLLPLVRAAILKATKP
jgi:hypothetical protein